MAATLLPSLNESLMGLREKLSVYNMLLFYFQWGSLVNFKISVPEKLNGGVLLATYCPSNEKVIPNQCWEQLNTLKSEISNFSRCGESRL